MFVPQGTPPLHGTSFARIAAELGLTGPAPSPTASSSRTAVPAQRSPRRERIEVATR